MSFDPNAALLDALIAHGIDSIRSGEGVLARESGLTATCEVVRRTERPAGWSVQLDVRIEAPRLGGRLLIESLAGMGSNEFEAAKQAFQKFLQASLHVILAALINPELGHDQVEWEEWSVAGSAWHVCLGPLFYQGSPPDGIEFGHLLDQIKESLVPGLRGGPHWLRIYYFRNGADRVASEALLDNNQWTEGHAIVDGWDWPEGHYGARHFLMFVPVWCF